MEEDKTVVGAGNSPDVLDAVAIFSYFWSTVTVELVFVTSKSQYKSNLYKEKFSHMSSLYILLYQILLHAWMGR